MVDEVGMVIYIPLWYLLIPAGRSACACLMRHLHSTMVSINHISHYVSSIERGIYIPLWYLLIGNHIAVVDQGRAFTFHYGIY